MIAEWTRNWDNAQLLRQRMAWLRLVFVLPFLLIGIRLVQLQVSQHENLLERGENQSLRSVPVPAYRGEIHARGGEALVRNAPLFQLWATPDLLRKPPEKRFLEYALNITDGELRNLFQRNVQRRIGKQTMLMDNLPFDAASKLLVHAAQLSSVRVQTTFQRLYLDDASLAHILGYIGEASADEVNADGSEFDLGDRVGKAGIEKTYNTQLFGRNGENLVRVDAHGYPIDVAYSIPPRHGEAITLSIDWPLQQKALELMTPHTGALIALDPRNGEILASVSHPSMHLDDFRFRVDPTIWRSLIADPFHPLVNRVFQGVYPPGSTYKPVVAIGALTENLTSPAETLSCHGSYRVGRRVFRCWKKEGHGSVNLHKALRESCDVYFYEMGRRLGVDRIAKYARLLGLGQRTGVEIANENGGLIPTAKWKQDRYGQPWMEGETPSVAIGQGFDLVTPAQLARMYATLAMHGSLNKLSLVRQDKMITPGEGGQVPDSVYETVNRALAAVVNETGGTGGWARVPDITVAGKTGTAQVVSNQDADLEHEDTDYWLRDHAWFVAFAPVENPQIVVAVLIEHGGHGGSAAAPVAGDLMRYFFGRKS